MMCFVANFEIVRNIPQQMKVEGPCNRDSISLYFIHLRILTKKILISNICWESTIPKSYKTNSANMR